MVSFAVPSRFIAQMHCRYWGGYNDALGFVLAVLDGIGKSRELSDEQRSLMRSVYRLVRDKAPAKRLLVENPINSQLAAKYAISQRTVTNWRRNGCPFEKGQWQVLDWAAEQRLLPRGFKDKFAKQLQSRREKETRRNRWEALLAGVQEMEQAVREAESLGFL